MGLVRGVLWVFALTFAASAGAAEDRLYSTDFKEIDSQMSGVSTGACKDISIKNGEARCFSYFPGLFICRFLVNQKSFLLESEDFVEIEKKSSFTKPYPEYVAPEARHVGFSISHGRYNKEASSSYLSCTYLESDPLWECSLKKAHHANAGDICETPFDASFIIQAGVYKSIGDGGWSTFKLSFREGSRFVLTDDTVGWPHAYYCFYHGYCSDEYNDYSSTEYPLTFALPTGSTTMIMRYQREQGAGVTILSDIFQRQP